MLLIKQIFRNHSDVSVTSSSSHGPSMSCRSVVKPYIDSPDRCFRWIIFRTFTTGLTALLINFSNSVKISSAFCFCSSEKLVLAWIHLTDEFENAADKAALLAAASWIGSVIKLSPLETLKNFHFSSQILNNPLSVSISKRGGRPVYGAYVCAAGAGNTAWAPAGAFCGCNAISCCCCCCNCWTWSVKLAICC